MRPDPNPNPNLGIELGMPSEKKSSYGGKLVILILPPPPPRQVGNKKEGNLLKVADPLPPYGSREYFLLQ